LCLSNVVVNQESWQKIFSLKDWVDRKENIFSTSGTHCSQKGHSIDLKKTDCPAYGQKCAKCQQKGHYAGVCKSRGGDKKDEAQHDSKKTTAGANHFTINRMKMSEKSGKISRVSQSTQNLMRKQQNMKKLRHEVLDEEEKMYIKSGLPEEPKLKIRMCVDILA
jgi:hypothetical protein